MATGEKEKTTSAWETDKLYGQRMDQVFDEREPFWLLGSRFVEGETIETDIGPAQPVHLLVQKLDENDRPQGNPFEVNAIAKAIVDKMRKSTATDFPAKVVWFKAWSKKWKTNATVLQFAGSEHSTNELAELYGIDPATIPGAVPY